MTLAGALARRWGAVGLLDHQGSGNTIMRTAYRLAALVFVALAARLLYLAPSLSTINAELWG